MTPTPTSWQAWIFDLDDTLLDTSGTLIPEAMKGVCEFLVEKKATPSLDHCLNLWEQWHHKKTGKALLQVLVSSPSIPPSLLDEAYLLFRRPHLPNTLVPIPGAWDILKKSFRYHPLFLVTQGDLETQKNKVERLHIRPFFEQILFVDPLGDTSPAEDQTTFASKEQAFRQILSRHHYDPNKVLVIGNRRNDEIAAGQRIGAQTCFFAYGEHRHEAPHNADEFARFEITHLTELESFLPLELPR